MFDFSPTEVAAGVVAIMSTMGAIHERYRNRKKEVKTEAEQALLSDAKSFQMQSEVFRKAAEDNLSMYQREREEHSKTRNYWHEQANKFNASLLAHKEQIAELQSRPDYSGMLRLMERQQATSTQILEGIHELLTVFKTVHASTIKREHDTKA